MQFGNRRKVRPYHDDEDEDVMEQEFHDVKKPARYPPLTVCVQVILIALILVILFFGVLVTLIGVWAHHSQTVYLSITLDPTELTRFPMATMVTGIFVSGLALVGLIGSMFFRTVTGKTLLGTFTFVMVLLIISELAAGAAIFRFQSRIKSVYLESAIASLMLYEASNVTSDYTPTGPKWDHFQEVHRCCGAEGYINEVPPYFEVFNNNSVPMSCCDFDNSEVSEEYCETYAQDAVQYKEFIYNTGCPDAIIRKVEDYILVVAVCVLVAGLSQLCAVVFAVTLLYINSRQKTKEKSYYKYNKLSLKGSNPIESS